MKTIFVVTHGDKFSGKNPGMTRNGAKQVRALRPLLPNNPPVVVCGTGRRHINVARALKLQPTRFTPAVGGPDSLEIVNGEKVILLADGTAIRPDQYTGLDDMALALTEIIFSLPDGSVICAGRPSIIMLGEANAKSSAVYKITVAVRTSSRVGELCAFNAVGGLFAFRIDEVVATGQTEIGTV